MKLLTVIQNFFKRTFNMELYIVTLDTTFANKLGKSLQNYGFVLASDANMARERFLQPLRQKVPPHVLAEIFPYVFAYKLSDVTEGINDQNPIWSYVPTSQGRSPAQQVRTPFISAAFQQPHQEQNVFQQPEPTAAPVAPPAPVVEEFKAPEGVTDPVQIAMLKTIHDLAKEVKSLKSAPAQGTAKVSVQDLEARFHAPAAIGDRAIDPNSVPIPDVANVTVLPKGKIDATTLARLRQNISKTRFEDVDEPGGGVSAGNN